MDEKDEARSAALKEAADTKKLPEEEIGRIRALAEKKAEDERARYGEGEWDREFERELWKAVRECVWETARAAARRIDQRRKRDGGRRKLTAEDLDEAFSGVPDRSWRATGLLDDLIRERLEAVKGHFGHLSRKGRAEFLGLTVRELYGGEYGDDGLDTVIYSHPDLFHEEWEEDWTDYEAVMAAFPDLFAYDAGKDEWSLTEEGEKLPYSHGISAWNVLRRHECFREFPEDRAGGRHTLTAGEYGARGNLII